VSPPASKARPLRAAPCAGPSVAGGPGPVRPTSSSARSTCTRARLVAALNEAVVAAVAEGDAYVALVADEALGWLLAESEPGLVAAADLEAVPAKRGQR